MAVYVDEIVEYPPERIKPAARRWGTRWCHLTADDREELHAFARRLGLHPRWFMDHPYCWHYDLTAGLRIVAVRIGAIEESREDAARRAMRFRAALKAEKEGEVGAEGV